VQLGSELAVTDLHASRKWVPPSLDSDALDQMCIQFASMVVIALAASESYKAAAQLTWNNMFFGHNLTKRRGMLDNLVA